MYTPKKRDYREFDISKEPTRIVISGRLYFLSCPLNSVAQALIRIPSTLGLDILEHLHLNPEKLDGQNAP